MFHYLFPPLTIGLSVVLVYLLAMRLWTKDALYESAAKFWTKIFGLNFALGVVTGIVMEFEFGTNWARYSRFVGDVFGSALAAEGIFAFFLESGFLAVLLFGWNRVGPRMHLFSAMMVSLGSIFSAVWIVVANSWQQTPAGHHIVPYETVGGETLMRAEIVDFWAMVFNPSTIPRLTHVWIGALILGAFFVMSISAYYLLKNKHLEFAKRSFRGALLLATIASIAQGVSGHLQAQNVAKYQPAKLAAFEAHWKTQKGAGLYIFGWPDEKNKTVRFGVAIPGMLSFLVHEDFDAEVVGLDDLEKDWGKPNIWLSFQCFHIMVGIGVLFIITTLYACFLMWRGKLFESKWMLRYFVFAVFLAFVANELGWVAAEVGRQPWIVYPMVDADGRPVPGTGLKTADALSESVTSELVLGSIIMFGVVYFVLFILWIFLLNHKIQQGPEDIKPETTEGEKTDKGGVLAPATGKAEEGLTGEAKSKPEGDSSPERSVNS